VYNQERETDKNGREQILNGRFLGSISHVISKQIGRADSWH
jgi:hypothetical protein